MRILFNTGLFLLLSYLVANAALSSVEGERSAVQLVAGLGILAMLAYCFVCGLKRFRITRYWPFSRVWFVFVAVMILYYALALVDLPSGYASKSPRSLFVGIYIIVTACFVYYGVVNRHLTDRKLVLMTAGLFGGALVELYLTVTNPITQLGMEVINTGSGYVFAMLLPLLMYRYRNQSLWVFIVLLGLTALTGKRGALVIFCLLALFYALNLKTIGHAFKFNYKTGIAAALAVLTFSNFMEIGYESLVFRIETMVHPERGSVGSGRDVIWITLLGHWWHSGVPQFFFGSGYYSALAIEGHVAHNDYIEFLVGYGVMGIFIFLVFQYRLYRDIRSVRNLDKYLYCMLFMCLIVFVGRSVFAGTIRTDQIYWSVSIGYLLGIATLKGLDNGFKN